MEERGMTEVQARARSLRGTTMFYMPKGGNIIKVFLKGMLVETLTKEEYEMVRGSLAKLRGKPKDLTNKEVRDRVISYVADDLGWESRKVFYYICQVMKFEGLIVDGDFVADMEGN